MGKPLTREEQDFIQDKFGENKSKAKVITLTENIVLNGDKLLRKDQKIVIKNK